MDSGLFNEKEVKAEAQRQSEYINVGFASAVFIMTLSCLGTPNPSKTAWLCLPIVIGMAIDAIRKVPVTIRTLRELERETKDPHVVEARKYLESKYLGPLAIAKNSLFYWIGFSFYLAVLFHPPFVSWLRE
ncbi:MAG TPA: hypothetical protein VFV48_03760 [Pseudomonadales bacterium]|nr:hypothetical protein [Pseudomonadales bacterium]